MTRRGWFLFLALGAIWGVPYLLIKVAVRTAFLARAAGGHEPLGAWRVAGLVIGLAGVVALLGLDLGRGDALAI